MAMAEGTPEYGGPGAPQNDRDPRENNGDVGNGGSRENAGSGEQDRNASGEQRPPRPGGPYGYGEPYGPYGQYPRNAGRGRYGGEQRGERQGDPRAWREYPPPRDPRRGPPPGYPAQQDSKAFCILSYVGVLWLVGLLAARDDPKVRFHVNQGIILSIFQFALGILVSMVKSFISMVFIRMFSASVLLPQLGMTINGGLSFVSWCLTVAFAVIGIVHAAQDRQEPLPIIGSLFTVIS